VEYGAGDAASASAAPTRIADIISLSSRVEIDFACGRTSFGPQSAPLPRNPTSAMIAGTASMGFRSEEITRDRERREEKASEKAPAPAPNTPAGADGSGTPVADGLPLEAPPVPLRRMSTFARMSRSMSKIKAPIPKFFRKGVVAVSSDAAGEIVARMAQDQPVSFRERLFLVMTEPSTGRVAKLVATFSWLVVLADGAATILETEAAITEATGTMFWVYYKFAINFAFTVEAIIRFYSFIPLAEAWRQPFTWLDLLTLIPFYIRIGFFWDTVAPGTASLSQARRRLHHHHHHTTTFAAASPAASRPSLAGGPPVRDPHPRIVQLAPHVQAHPVL